MSRMTRSAEPIYIGLDVHKDSIMAAILRPEEDAPGEVGRIGADLDSVRHLFGRFADPRRLRACYEAGPTGYGLHRYLSATLGVHCEVIAPSLVPKAPGDRVKTDRRDARRLARLYRSGELTAIRVPTEAEEAMRDLCRARAAMLADAQRTKRRLLSLLLRHGRVYPGGYWTQAHRGWLAGQRFTEPALGAAYAAYLSGLAVQEADLAAIDAELDAAAAVDPFAEPVRRLAGYRGVARVGALTLTAEVCDWRRFGSAGAFMKFTGLTPSEHSSGQSSHRGRITKTGNAHIRTQLIESAWAYQRRPLLSAALTARQHGLSPDTIARSWATQQRLCRRWRHLADHKTVNTVIATAIARELAGFLWAEMTS